MMIDYLPKNQSRDFRQRNSVFPLNWLLGSYAFLSLPCSLITSDAQTIPRVHIEGLNKSPPKVINGFVDSYFFNAVRILN